MEGFGKDSQRNKIKLSLAGGKERDRDDDGAGRNVTVDTLTSVGYERPL